MKTILSFSYLLIASVLTAWVSAGCSRTETETTTGLKVIRVIFFKLQPYRDRNHSAGYLPD